MKKIWMTGSTGFIGQHVVRRLVDSHYSLHLFLRREPDQEWLKQLGPFITWEVGSLEDEKAVLTSLQHCKPQTLLHLAAYGVRPEDRDWNKAVQQNVWVPSMLLENANEVGATSFVMIGSSAEYGDTTHEITEDSLIAPLDLYGSSKAAGAIICQQLARQHQMTFLSLRVFNVFGEGQNPNSFIGYVMRQLLAQQPLSVSPCEQERDFLYVHDVVEAIVKAVEVDDPIQEMVNIGSGETKTLKAYIEKIKEHIQSSSVVQYGALPYRQGERMYAKPSIEKAKKLLGWEPKWTLDEGIKATLGEMKENGNSKS